jgi:hypothetical protein
MYGELVMIDASEELRNTPKVNYNIQMSFKRVPNGKKNKVDHWSFWEESWTLALSNISLHPRHYGCLHKP